MPRVAMVVIGPKGAKTEVVPVEAGIEMWGTLLLTAAAIAAYASERISIELTSLGTLGALLLLFHVGALWSGEPMLEDADILRGFASPALIAVSALLVVGQAMVSTGALEGIARLLIWLSRGSFERALLLTLGYVTASSAFLNNTPIVVIFIPIMRSIAERFGRSASGVMMPLSFAAILGGMLTLIGTSTNLLVSGELARFTGRPFGFFDMTIPGLVLVLFGSAWVILLPKLLRPPREPPPGQPAAEGRQFIAELDIVSGSNLIGESSRAGLFPGLTDVTVRLIQRGYRTILPPFENVTLEAGDVLIVAATRKVLTAIFSTHPGHLLRTSSEVGELPVPDTRAGDLVLSEAMIKPASRMIGQTLELTNFPERSHCNVLGIERRARMLRTRLHELRLEPGDVLLLVGRQADIERLRGDPDVLPIEWSASDLPLVRKAPLAAAILAAIVLPAALGVLPIVVTAVLGVIVLIATGCLNVRQAARAVDRQIVLIIATSLALGSALEATGGAAYLAALVLNAMAGAPAAAVLSVLFLLVALLTNVLTNNAAGVLFTPVAVNVAAKLGVDPFPFALAVAFGASCSFATPIGYQTNLLVMGPGHYRFRDFIWAGTPLVIIVWLAFSLFAPWYYGV
jgi:di/tricarboxylate transporter